MALFYRAKKPYKNMSTHEKICHNLDGATRNIQWACIFAILAAILQIIAVVIK